MCPPGRNVNEQAYDCASGDSRGGCSVFTAMSPDRLDPFTTDGEWLRCALHAHTTRSDGELEPDALAAHYAPCGLRRARHHRPLEADGSGYRRPLLVLPSVELNCILPAARDGHVLGFGIVSGRRSRRSRRRVRGPGSGPPGSSPTTAAWPTSHIPTGPARLPARWSCPRTWPGSRSGTPAASSRWGGGCPRFTGTSCSRRAPAASGS